MMGHPFAALINWFARNAVAANLLMVILLASGFYTVLTIKKEMQPRIETNYISVAVPFLGATPADVEEGVVIKIEEAIQDIEGIEEIISTASRGYGNVTIEVNADYEVTDVMDQVKNRVDAISTFPENTEKPTVSRTEFQQQVVMVTVYGDVDERTLKEYAKQVRNDIVVLPGVTRAQVLGGRPYEVSLDRDLKWIHSQAGIHQLEIQDLEISLRRPSTGDGRVKAPIPGLVTRVMVSPGDEVQAGQPLMILEAMKMENEIRAPRDGVIERLNVRPGQQVALQQVLVEVV